MTAQRNPYVRVFYRIVDDPKFADVFDNDARLACWLRLLILADGAYPAPAPIPRSVKATAFDHLVSVGLIDRLPGDRFRVHGLERIREERSEQASEAARKRWGDAPAMRSHSERTSVSNAVASEDGMHSAPLHSTPLRSHPSEPVRNGPEVSGEPDRHGLPHITPVVAGAVEEITGRSLLAAGDRQLTELDRLCEDHGDQVLPALLAVAGGKRLTARQLVWDTMKVLEPFAKPKEAEAVRKSGENEADWQRRVERTRRETAEIRKAMGYDA